MNASKITSQLINILLNFVTTFCFGIIIMSKSVEKLKNRNDSFDFDDMFAKVEKYLIENPDIDLDTLDQDEIQKLMFIFSESCEDAD